MSDEKILLLLKKKRGFFESILDLTETEETLAVPEWVTVLEQKKVLLGCIDEIDEKLIPYKDTLHALSQEITEELQKIRKIVKSILHYDSQNQEKRKRELKHYHERR